MSPRRKRTVQGLAGLLALTAYLGMAVVSAWDDHLVAFFFFYLLAFGACWIAARSGLGFWPILAGALIFRGLLVPSDPVLSEDVFRYVWEGRVQRAGFDPYVLPPAAPELETLRDANWPRINYPEATAIYPPLAQLTFRALAAWGGVTLFKGFFALVDVAVVLLLAAGLRKLELPLARLALYAWNPLAVVEVAGSGHLEPLALFPFLLALLLGMRRKAWAWCCLAASLAVKYSGAWVAPILLRSRRPSWGIALITLVGLVLVGLPFADAGWEIFASLRLYAAKWRFNDLLFLPLLALSGSLTKAKIVAAALVLLALGWMLRQRVPLLRATLLLTAILVLVSPTIHPWYLLWFAVLLPLVPCLPLFLWSGTIVFAYLFLFPAAGYGPLPQTSLVPRLAQMLPLLVGFLWERGRRKRARATVARAPSQIE